LPARRKRRRPTSASNSRRTPRGPKETLWQTSRACATATPNRSPRWSAMVYTTAWPHWSGRSRFPPCWLWGAKHAARAFPSPRGQPWRTRCTGARWRRPTLATEYTGMTLRATSGS
jgi:hypothetical protein